MRRHLLAASWPLLVALAGAAPAAAQSRPTGYVSAFLDVLPNARIGGLGAVPVNAEAIELRARAFAEHRLAPAEWFRINLSGFAEGLLARRGGEPVDDAVFRVQEASVELLGDRVDLLAGFTRVAWGRLDELQPTDVINPLDVSRFFFEGRAEARMPVALARGRLFVTDDLVVEAVYVPFFRRGRFDQLHEPTSPFNLAGNAGAIDRAPAATLRHAQGGGRISATTRRLDWSVYGFRGIEPFGLYRPESPVAPLTGPPGPLPTLPPIVRTFPRFTMFGADFETVRGQWGVRGEIGAFVDDSFQDAAGIVGGRSFDAGVGVDRKAGGYRIATTVLVHREEYDRPIIGRGGRERSRTDVSLSGSGDRSFAREKYQLRVFGVYAATESSGFLRGILTAKVRDDVAVEGSAGWFIGGGRDLIGRFEHSDFAYARLKYYF